MRSDPNDVVVGLPALTAREVVRGVIRYQEVDEELFAHICQDAGVPAGREHATLAALCRLAYLEPLEPDPHRPEPRWCFTRLGSSFAWAHATKPIRRATADRLLAELVERARARDGAIGTRSAWPS